MMLPLRAWPYWLTSLANVVARGVEWTRVEAAPRQEEGRVSSARELPILLVDDDESILTTIELLLAEEGYAVAVAANGRDALQRIAAQRPCLILLDMKMPVMDGWAFAAAYRELPGPHAPIVVMTAAHDSHQRAAEICADGVIAKPFDVNHLLDLVRKYAA